MPTISTAQAKALGIITGKRARKPPSVSTGTGYGLDLTLTLPIRVISEANRRDHWATARKRAEAQDDAVIVAVNLFGLGPFPEVPMRITLTRVGGRRMDRDNLARSVKHVQDSIARNLLPMDDGDPRIDWRYEQEAGKPEGVRVRIEVQA